MKNQEIKGSFRHGLLFSKKMGVFQSSVGYLRWIKASLNNFLVLCQLAFFSCRFFQQSCYTFTVLQIRTISNNRSQQCPVQRRVYSKNWKQLLMQRKRTLLKIHLWHIFNKINRDSNQNPDAVARQHFQDKLFLFS